MTRLQEHLRDVNKYCMVRAMSATFIARGRRAGQSWPGSCLGIGFAGAFACRWYSQSHENYNGGGEGNIRGHRQTGIMIDSRFIDIP
jgi:hypothetical protein